jgi:AAA domain
MSEMRKRVDGVLDAAAGPEQADGSGESWEPVALDELAFGLAPPERPVLGRRTDDVALLYASRLHWLTGEPESGKTWLALVWVAEVLRAGRDAVYIDYEDTAAAIVGRLRALGVTPEAIVDHLVYVRPAESVSAGLDRLLAAIEGRDGALVIIDGVTEGLTIGGGDPNDNAHVARWVTLLPRAMVAATSAAVVCLDHVVKAKSERGRWSVGGGHKLAAVDGAAYIVEVIVPPRRDGAGRLKLLVVKDRPGAVRPHAVDSGVSAHIADVAIHSAGEAVIVNVSIPFPEDSTVALGPLMERVSRFIEANPDTSGRTIRDAVGGDHHTTDQALRALEHSRHVVVDRSNSTHHHHRSLRPYRDDDA